MAKKIIDIVPPQKDSFQVEEKVEVLKKGLKQKPCFRFPRFSKKTLAILGGLILALGVASFFVLRTQLTLYLSPLQETIKIEEEVKVDVAQEALDFQGKIVPGRVFETEEEKWALFQSTGSEFEGEKAKGVISVYNATTPISSLNLREQTRFLSSEGGKIFTAPEKIYLPPATMKGGKVVPSVTEVMVVAQEIGGDCNIGPSKFSVPGLTGTALYYTVWAESSKAMEGGFKKETKKITTEDLETAQTSLKTALKGVAKNSLDNKLPEGFDLKEGAVFEKEAQVSCFQEAGSKVAEFNCQGKIKAEGLAFRTGDLEEMAHQFIAANIPPSKKPVPQAPKMDISPRGTLAEGGKMILSLKIEAKVYEEINRDVFLNQIEAKTQGAIEEIIFKNYPQIENVKFKFWPFWNKKAPSKNDRIKILLTF